MELVFFVLLCMPSIGIPPVWGFNLRHLCRHATPVIRCEDGLVISVQKRTNGRITNGNIYCGENSLPMSRQPDITPCQLKFLQSKCDNTSSCYLSEQHENLCSINERPKHFLTYKCISRCGLNYSCNEPTEECRDSEDGAECICAENYHKNDNDVCTRDLYLDLFCDRGVINITESQSRTRPTLKVYRDQEVISRPAPCSSIEELNNTKTRCNNKQFCKIPDRVNNVVCISYMIYDCVPKCGFNDGCNMTTQVCKDVENDIKCECAENYQKNSEGFCAAMDIPQSEITQCANESISIRCHSGVINVERARSNERPTFTVNCVLKVLTNYSAPCLSNKGLDVVTAECNNKSNCEISDKLLEDNMCHSYMNYTCAMNTAHSEVLQCANKNISIYCDIGIIHIEPTRGDGKPNFTVNCGERIIKNYSFPCLSNDELANMRSECDNKSSCNIADKMSKNSPCHNYLNYKCVSRCGVTDNCNEISEVCSEGKNGTECHCAKDYKRNNEGVCIETPPTCHLDIQYVKGILLTFNETLTRQVAYSRELCPPKSSYPNRSLASRNCKKAGRWGEVKTTKCYLEDTFNAQLEEMSRMNVTDDNVEEVGGILVLASAQVEHITDDGLDSLITSLDSIVQVGNPTPEVTDSVVGVVSNIMTINDSTLDDPKNVNSIVTILENQVASVLEAGKNYSEVTENLEVNAVQMERASLKNNYTFHSHLKGGTSYNDDVEEEYKKSSILLPASLLHLINEGFGIVPISLIAYQDNSLFQTNDVTSSKDSRTTEYIDSHVISATVELDNVIVKGLPSNSTVLARFSYPTILPDLNETNITVEFVCVYWDKKEAEWSQEGCSRAYTKEDEEIVCSCDHLTSFAVLVRVQNVAAETPFYRALTITSKVGCIISILSLSFCVSALLIVRPVRKKQQTHVHLNLCLALLGFYFAFLLGIDKAKNPRLCEAMTSLIYFFCLSSMAWMSVEAFYIYMLIWKYKRSGIRHFIPVAAFFAWGFPAFGSVLVYILEEPHDYINEPDYCFLHPGNVLNFGFVLEIGILFLYNITVFSLVTYRVSCRKIYFSNKDEKRVEIMTRVKSTFLFWILLGISWMFAFLSILQNPPNPVFEVMFSICFSLQGFVMLYMLILQNPEMMKNLRAKRKPVFSSVTMASGMKNVYVMRKDSCKGSTLGMQSNPLSSTSEYY